ncbi:hypothetical protein [Nodosilinea nodulosa]|uniref:hypothetical protein n=1 Tax=Nodosilinea nodulosa TaxID=416001 RepID=UPI00030B097B|nr:hypothetical protein [Nodosilinea nodulosa]
MTPSEPDNEILEIVKGMLLLLGCHAIAAAVIFGLGFLVALVGQGGYGFVMVWLVGGVGFLFWQLLYAIPLILRLRRRGHMAMAKGVIIAAVLTALVNGTCFAAFFMGGL